MHRTAVPVRCERSNCDLVHSGRFTERPIVIWHRPLCVTLLVLLLGTGAAPSASAAQFNLAPVADTYVESGHPAQSHGSEPGLWVGYDQAGGYLSERALIAFDPSAIPVGSTITSATLGLYVAGTTTSDPPLTVGVYRVRSAWSETITWQEHLGLTVDASPVATKAVPSTLGWVT